MTKEITQQKRLRKIVSENIAPAMRAEGFRREGNWFNREREATTDHLNVVSSANNTSQEVNFTLEAYVMGKGGRPMGDKEIARKRIGHLKTGRDQWYKLTPQVDLEELGRTIEQDLSDYIMPFFQTYE
jgi:hypothetical protein